ncbi:hypothetical protein SAY86_027420 [Trapa natans]|uniref:Uncharacterized protein n=1 Tax=Trapa natans TaxID=22666 RepID=A0AAN7KT12_TRANT|nr:hypothetical protein SAY86_027420 [Trapa natans]
MDDYSDEFDDEDSSREIGSSHSVDSDVVDSDFESSKAKTDTSAVEAREGKDIQGIPWERLHFTRDKYRQIGLKQYKNYKNLPQSRLVLAKDCLSVKKGKKYYDFQFNTMLVGSTISHFQL